MSKILKIVAAGLAIAAIIASAGSLAVFGSMAGATLFGVSATAFAIASGIASLGAGLLMKRPKLSASGADRARLVANIEPRTPRTIIFGRTAMATDIRDQEFSGTKQEFLHRFIVCASHKVNAIQEIWFDDKLAWTVAGGVQGEYVGYLTVTPILEGSAANAINISARMGATRRYTGLSYVHFTYKLTGNTKKSESPFASAVPSRMTIIGEGIAVYDPRQDTTAGGAGAHRADNQATWTYGAHARNPALQALTYMLGWRINGLLAVGKGIPKKRFDMAAFMTAANVCDELVPLKAGGTEPRYRSDGIFSEADDLSVILSAFEATMDGQFYDPQGRIAVKCFVDDLGTPTAAFGPDDVLSGVQWQPFGDLAESFNVVRGTYTDASTTSLYQSVDYPEQSVASLDGIERIYTLDLPLVQSQTQAQRLAKRARLRAQLGSGIVQCEMQATAWRTEQLAPVTFTFPHLSFVAQKCRVAEIETRTDGIVPIMLITDDPAIYAWNPATDERDGLQAIASTPYLPGNNPFVIDMPTTLQISRIDPASGRGLETFQSANAVPYTEILETGSSRNTDVVTFASIQSRVPKVIFAAGGNAAPAGQNVVIEATGVSTSGFTMRAVAQAVTVGATITDAGATVGGGANPDRVINRTNAGAPFDGRFAFNYSVTVGSIGGGEPGYIQIGLFVKKATIWTQVATDARSNTGSYTTYVSPGTVDFGAGDEFGISVIYVEGAGTALNAFTSVVYVLGTVTETSLTPAGASPIQWTAVLS